MVLSIAALKLIYYAIALYLWWMLTHDGKAQPTAIIGASAVIAIVIGGVVGPLLRDFAYGTSMMAEQWYAVGDLVTIEPFTDMRGVVDRITLRSTRISGLNGEVIWISNQSIAAVRVARKGVSTIAIELFVTGVDAATKLIADVNNLLPTGSALVAQTLIISHVSERTGGIWHITAIGETAPAREWILLETAIELLKSSITPKNPFLPPTQSHVLLTVRQRSVLNKRSAWLKRNTTSACIVRFVACETQLMVRHDRKIAHCYACLVKELFCYNQPRCIVTVAC